MKIWYTCVNRTFDFDVYYEKITRNTSQIIMNCYISFNFSQGLGLDPFDASDIRRYRCLMDLELQNGGQGVNIFPRLQGCMQSHACIDLPITNWSTLHRVITVRKWKLATHAWFLMTQNSVGPKIYSDNRFSICD